MSASLIVAREMYAKVRAIVRQQQQQSAMRLTVDPSKGEPGLSSPVSMSLLLHMQVRHPVRRLCASLERRTVVGRPALTVSFGFRIPTIRAEGSGQTESKGCKSKSYRTEGRRRRR